MNDVQTVHSLMMLSSVHRKWSADDFNRLVLPPLRLKQYYITKDRKAFLSWAFLTEEARDGYLNRTRKLQEYDWNNGDELWFIDFIAPYNNARTAIREIRENILPGMKLGKSSRCYGTGRVLKTGFFVRNEHAAV